MIHIYIYILIYITQDSQCFCLSIGEGYQGAKSFFSGGYVKFRGVFAAPKLRHLKFYPWGPKGLQPKSPAVSPEKSSRSPQPQPV